MLHFLEKSALPFLGKTGVTEGLAIAIVGFLFIIGGAAFIVPGYFETSAFRYTFALMPIWLPALMIWLFFETWITYIRRHFFYKNAGVLLEIKVPQEVMKSPLAIEFMLIQIWQTGSIDNWLKETYWLGKTAPVFSLEIASFEGQVHLYVYTFPRYKNFIETHLYAHYPGVEVIEVEDYAKGTVYDPARHTAYGIHFNKKNDSPYPILTYVDFGLDKDPKEEFKHDPIASIIEFMGSMGKGEQQWMQILIQAEREEGFDQARLFTYPDWRTEGKKIVSELMQRDPDTKLPIGGASARPMLGPGETDQVKAVERNISKFGFKTVIRTVYLAEHEHQRLGITVPAMIAALRQYEDTTTNGIRFKWGTDIYWWWQDYKGRRLISWKRKIIDAYKRRSAFEGQYKNWRVHPKVFSTEELASLFHLPGSSVQTPTLARIPSTRVEAPSNLPTGQYDPRSFTG